MDAHAYYSYKVLEHLEDCPDLTHRKAALKLNVSVKLIHTVIQKLLEKGWVHATARDGRSLFYFLTPAGIAEKVRLTYEFLEFSKQFYHKARCLSSEVCRALAESGVMNVALLGAGDLAEITYLGILEHRLRLTHVFDAECAGRHFMSQPVLPVTELAALREAPFAKVLVALYEAHEPMQSHHLPYGLKREKRFVWVLEPGDLIREIKERAPTPACGANSA